MPYNRVQVRAFLSASEIELFESSLGVRKNGLGKSELRRRLHRVRTLRDKARDLLQRQKLATRARTGSKLGMSGHANRRTAQKATAFAEALARFETAIAAREAADAAAADKSTSSRRAARSAKAPVKTPTKASTKKSIKKAARKTEARPPRARPAAVVLREALGKKRAGEAEQASAVKLARGAKKSSFAADHPLPGGVQTTAPSTRARAVASRLADSNLPHVQGHTSTQVRRSQAKRDQKG